jgi:hypothetical protein
MPSPSFDRVRPRTTTSPPEQPEGQPTRVPDREGKRVLFSATPEPPSFGSVAITCTRCEARSVISWSSALKLAFPSVPAVVPGSGVRLWLKCPTCRQRAWVEISMGC